MRNPFVVLLVGLIFTAGCGGGSSSSTSSGPTPTAITMNPSTTQQIDEGQSVNLSAVLTPATANQAVSWSLGGAGTLSNQTPTEVTYTAPSSGAAGTATVTAAATQTTSLAASVNIQYALLPIITTTSLPSATEGAVYDQTITATGGTGTLTFSLVGSTSLPTGLAMDSTGHITGLPTGPSGTTNFTVSVTDSSFAGSQTATKGLSITVNLASAPTITPSTLPNGNVGTPYFQTLTVNGGLGPHYSWSVVSGTLPFGLSLAGSNSTATISGIPTTVQSNVTFAIQVTDSSTPPQSPTQDYTISIGAALPLSITTTSLPPATLNSAYTGTISAQGGTGPYTFTLDAASGPLPPGLSFSSLNNQGVISGTATSLGTYNNIIVDVQDSASPAATAQQTFSLTVTTQALTITPSSLPAGTVGVGYNQTITATGGTSPYTFSLDPASNPLPPGLTFAAGAGQATISGTPTTTGAYSGILVDAQDSASPAATTQKSYSIAVYTPTTACGAGNESVLSGQYAFLLQGFDAQGPVGIAGSFTADGTGKITGGVEDINRSSGVGIDLPVTTASSSYSVGSDNRGCLTIASSAGTETFRFALGSIASGIAAQGHIVEFDASGTNAVGVLAKQDPTAFSNAQIGGGYAFGGSTALSGGGKAGIAGQFAASGGNITSGMMDINDDGAPQSLTTVTGNYDVTDTTNGRGTMTLSSLATPLNVSFYVVSAQKMFFLSTDEQSVNSPLAGTMRQQTGTPFSVSSLSGPAIFAGEGLGTAPGTSEVQLGLLYADGAGIFSFSADKNDGGTVGSSSVSGTYNIASNGRVTLTGGTNLPILYLYAQNQGFLVDTTSAVATGAIDPQAVGPFTNASLIGSYSFGDVSPVLNTTTLSSGVATANGAGNLTGTSDLNGDGTLAGGQALSTTYSVSTNGRAILGSNADILYIISPTKAVYMPIAAGNTNPNITFLDQ
jgi:large repetitive protein